MKKVIELFNDWILIKGYDKVDLSKENISFDKNGQWSLKKARLNIPDHWAEEFRAEQAAKKAGSAPPSSGGNNPGNKKLSDMFDKLNHAVRANKSQNEVNKMVYDIHDHVAGLKDGLDIGHLGKLVEAQPRNKHGGKVLNHAMLGSMLLPHLHHVKDLKEIHEKFGGDDAIRTIIRQHGANGTNLNYEYDNHTLHFKNPQVLGDLVHAINPGRPTNVWDDNGNEIKVTPSSNGTSFDPHLHKKVEDTWSTMMDDLSDNNSMRAHEDAVVERGLDHLKRHWGKP